ncbi:tetratricopeptide repeat protein [Shewanella olleyana]|uniref:tetratricopeptide repeat protein n=1 Tax=Shewanella olleyana TaxID=135626 RepID=UPI00200CA045|nr:tetratricopeptide repeat protein [Shewanella olleyana]MCL1068471.1 tetratricopeptide repeat protein [Shewanella olleyana]
MSVINKVLKDLDKQKQSTDSNVGESSSGFVKPEVQFTSQLNTDGSEESSSRKGMYMSIAMLTAVAIFGFMFYRQGVQIQNLQPLAEAKQTQAQTQNQAQTQTIAANETSKLTEVQDNELKSGDINDVEVAKAQSEGSAYQSASRESVTNEVTEASTIALAKAKEVILASEGANISTTSNADEFASNSSTSSNTGISPNSDNTSAAQSVSAELQEPKGVVKVDSKMASITEVNSLRPSKVNNGTSNVQVRFSQNTRTSSIVDDVKTNVNTGESDKKLAQLKQVNTTNRAELSASNSTSKSTKGVMAVKEVILTDAQLAQKKFDIAEVAEQQQKIDRAVKYYYEALVLDPSMHQARKQLASLYYALNNLGRAEQILAQGVAQFPEEVELAILKAKVENASFSPMKALTTLEGISDGSDWKRDKWILQSDIAQKNGRFELAESAYRSLISIEPSQARWWMGLAYALDSQQQYSQAADAYQKALSYRGLSTGAMTYIEQRLIQLGGSQ